MSDFNPLLPDLLRDVNNLSARLIGLLPGPTSDVWVIAVELPSGRCATWLWSRAAIKDGIWVNDRTTALSDLVNRANVSVRMEVSQ